MNRDQLIKLLKVGIITTSIILVLESIFAFPQVSNFFTDLISQGSNDWIFYSIVWAIMFLQVTILNIPAYSVLIVCNGMLATGVLNFVFIAVTLSAYMCGSCLAYWLGRKFGTKAVKWIAGSQDDFDKWSAFINKKGRWFYFATVLFPFFPDDLLCLVAGATHMKFSQYFLFNLIGRGIGLVTMCAFLGLLTQSGIIGGSFPTMVIVWGVLLIAEVITYIVLKRKSKEV